MRSDHAATIALAALVGLVIGGCSGGGTQVRLLPDGFHRAVFRDRVGDDVTLVMTDGGEPRLHLVQLAVFDCRSDCLVDVKTGLAPVPAGEPICLASVGAVFYKLWVDRAECREAGAAPR